MRWARGCSELGRLARLCCLLYGDGQAGIWLGVLKGRGKGKDQIGGQTKLKAERDKYRGVQPAQGSEGRG